ncbi:HAD family hydrolase [Blastopirellula sp. JC732]|uniref:D,D-heptose 1,7-bisphosphate phosphatase n=1 Tax=Blastopirellula sediminis TaxID=2894196 RepID=A0A9X1MNH5_9BACT|nr:HAD family hydrolase [Blastopirellula sediminis]MCC9607185.1 HAD family hydrolase [Blastopirellula sediminis]MCC9629522.1 HAD family hydrolase [Blastopirellula sediminis]
MSNAGGALFLDRDGTINVEREYLSDPQQLELLPDAAAAIAAANQAKVPVIVVTNQSGVARGMFPESRIAQVHRRLDELLAQQGAAIDAYYYCPHHPKSASAVYRVNCQCRKPRAGMLFAAAAELGIDLRESVVIGDKASDLGLGPAAECQTILVRTGYGRETEQQLPAAVPSLIGRFDTLLPAVEYWLHSRLERSISAA